MIRASILAVALLSWGTGLAEEPLPQESVYHLDVTLTDQDGDRFQLADRRGEPLVVSMFYASCPHVCPMLINTMQRTERQLEASEVEELEVLLISLDPERDGPEAFQDLVGRYGLDTDRWSLAVPDAADVRTIAAALGIRFRQLPDGDFNHTTVLILLNEDGVPVTRSETIPRVDPKLVDALRRTARD